MLHSETAAVGGRTKGKRLEAVPEDETDEEEQMDVAHGTEPERRSAQAYTKGKVAYPHGDRVAQEWNLRWRCRRSCRRARCLRQRSAAELQVRALLRIDRAFGALRRPRRESGEGPAGVGLGLCYRVLPRRSPRISVLRFVVLRGQVLNLTRQNCKPERLFVDFAAVTRSSIRTIV